MLWETLYTPLGHLQRRRRRPLLLQCNVLLPSHTLRPASCYSFDGGRHSAQLSSNISPASHTYGINYIDCRNTLDRQRILSNTSRLSPDEKEEQRAQIQQLKDLNKKERVNKLRQELVRLRLAQASTSAPPYIPNPIAGTSGTQRQPLVVPESTQASSSSEGDSFEESDYLGGSCSRASSRSPSRERARECWPYTRYRRWTTPWDIVRVHPASPYRRAPVEV